jgi:hypothetical protein
MQAPAQAIPGLPASIGMNWVIQEVDGVRTLVGNASERQDLSRHVMRLSAEVAVRSGFLK